MPGSMRIVHVGVASDVPVLHRFGGAVQRRIRELAKVQARRGHRVVVYSFGAAGGVEEQDGVEFRTVRCLTPHPLRQVEFQLRAIGDLRRRGEPVDVLHSHGQPEAGVLGRGLGARVLLSYDNFSFRGGRHGPLGRLYRSALERFDLLLPCSEYCRDASSAHWGLDPSRLHVLHNGVDLDQFRPDPDGAERERRALGLSGPTVLYVGRVCEQKGTSLLLDAWARRAGRSDAKLVVAGPVERFGTVDDGTWTRRIEAVGGVYLGAVEEARLSGLYSMADLFVMPTIELEMFGMAAVEAQACGTSVLASDHGGLRETVPDAVGGRFRNGDAADLAARLDALLADEDGRQERSAAARRNAARFSWDTVCERLQLLVDDASSCYGRRRGARR